MPLVLAKTEPNSMRIYVDYKTPQPVFRCQYRFLDAFFCFFCSVPRNDPRGVYFTCVT
jgi:hypothetical protein